MFITFEGIDGVGKSTQAKLLSERLQGKVLLTHEPGGTPFGLKVRQLIKTEEGLSVASQFHLIEAQRDHHVRNVIIPALASGTTVICDRFLETSYVYQNSYKDTPGWYEYLNDYVIVPDIVYLMYTDDVPAIKKRMADRAGVEMDHFDNASVNKLIHMQELFFSLVDIFPRIVPINTDRSIMDISDIIERHARFALEDSIHSEET